MNRMIFSTYRDGLLLAPFIALFLLLAISFSAQAAIVHAGTNPQASQAQPLGLVPVQNVKPDGEYVIYVQKGDGWRKIGELSFDRFFRERKINLREFAPLNEPATIRLVQKRGGAAHIDSLRLGGQPPVEVKGTGETLALKKLAKKDFDVLDAYGKTLDLLFPAHGPDRILSLVARIEGIRITETPFHYPTRNLYRKMTPKSAFYTYHLADTKIAAAVVDGRLKASNEPFFKEWSDTGTGHPSGYTYGWVANDDRNLYVKLDFTPDDTMDSDKDYSKVYVKTDAGLKEFKITASETKWGAVDFTYTDKAAYQHKVYDFKIPFRELGIKDAARAKDLQLAFAAYGTAAPLVSDAVVVNPVTNKIYVANRTSGVVTVIDGATGVAAMITDTVDSGPATMAVNTATNKIYVANYGDGVASGTVTVIDGATNTASATPITVGSGPIAIAVNPVTNLVYVANSSSASVTVIDGGDNVIATPTVGINPRAVAVNPVTNRIYVANFGDNNVSVIDGATNTASATPITTDSGPAAIAVNPVTNRVYVANYYAGNITVIDGAFNDDAHTATVAAGSGPRAIAVNPVTNKVYAACSGAIVTVIDGANNPATVTLTSGSPQSVAINTTTNRIYVPTNSGNVSIIEGASDTEVNSVTVGVNSMAVAVNPVTNKAYVADASNNSVIVIDGAVNAASSLTTGFSPYSVAHNPATNMVYVANSGSDTVTIINAMSGAVYTNRPVGSYPQGVAVDPAKNRVYVANYNSDNVSVINSLTNIVTDTISLPTGSGPQAITVNPVTGKVYTANYGANNVTVIDANKANAVSTVPAGARPYAIVVNPVTNTVYAVNKNGNSVTVIDGATDNVINTVAVGTTPLDIAVNTSTNKIYVANSASAVVTEIDGADNTTATPIPIGHTSRAIAVNPVTNRVYAANFAGNTVTVLNRSDNSTATVTVGTDPYAVAVNPVTNKIYTANYGSDNVTVIDGVTNATVTVAAGTQPQSLAINTLSNKVYTANWGSADGTNGVTIIEEQTTQSSPLTVNIATFADNVSAFSTPAFTFTTATTALPVQRVYYQLDTWQDTWKEATTFAANAGTVSEPASLSTGNHTIYMFAVDGQDATSTNTGFQSSPLIGSIAAYNFTVTGPPLPVAQGASMAFDGANDFVSIPNSSYTFTNGGFTVEAWINPSSLAPGIDYKGIIGTSDTETPWGIWSLFLSDVNPAYWGLTVCTPGCDMAQSPANAQLTVNQWQHVAASYDGVTIKIYLNGSLVASKVHASGGASYIANYLVIGKAIEAFNGKISEVRIWDGVHDATAIRATKDVILTGFESGLIGYWKLQEGFGWTVFDSSPRNKTGYLGGATPLLASMPGWAGLAAYYPFKANADDASGNGNNGAVNGATLTTDRFGNANSAYSFNGTTDNIVVNQTLGKFGTGDFSLSTWINPAANNILITGKDSFNGDAANMTGFLTMIMPSGQLRFGTRNVIGGAGPANYLDGSGTVPLNSWSHIVAVRQGGVLKTYLNGVLDGTLSEAGPTNVTNNVNYKIGTFDEGAVQFFSGTIDDLRVFNRALSLADVQSLYSETSAISQTLTVGKSGDGVGTVTSSPAGINCGATCSANFAGGIVVDLTATPGGGSVFAGWNGGGCSGMGTCSVTMDAAKNVTAYFDPQVTYSLTTAVAGTGGASGSVTPASGTFYAGSYQSISAIPDSVSVFDHWSGDCSGTYYYISFTMTGNMNCTANFAPIPAPQVTSTSPNTGGGIEDVTSAYSITAVFNVPMNPSSINAATYIVKDQGGNPVTGTVTYDSYDNMVTFIPASFLPAGGAYSATLTTGVQNSAGTPMAADYTWSFTVNPYLGGVPSEGNLHVTPLSNGRIGIYRYISGAWQRQIYSWRNKGSRLQVNGVGYPLGYFGNGIEPSLVANTQLSAGKTRTEWTTEDGLRIIQELTYQPGALYYGQTWTISNETAADVTDLRFFHGEDTYFFGDDHGAGFWDGPNNTIGVQRTIGTEQRRMSLQAITPPFAHDSEQYYTVYGNVNSGALTNTIDPSEYTDNGYALEWRTATLASGATWTIRAFEKFADVAVGDGLFVQAPVTASCVTGTPCSLSFNIINAGGVSQAVNLAVSTDQTGWTGQLAESSITVPAGATQQVIVTLAIPATAPAGTTGHVTLTANSAISDTGAVTVSVPPLSVTTATLPNGSYGASYSQPLAATGGAAPYSWSVASGTLPPGLTLAGGVISGTPTQAGSFSFTLQVADGTAVPFMAGKDFSITIDKAVLTVTSQNATRSYGTANPSFTAVYTGFVNGDSASVLTGSPALSTAATPSSPPGVYDITASQGTLAAANYSFLFVNGALTVTVLPLEVAPISLGGGSYGKPYTQLLSATGGLPPYTWSVVGGTLPPGLILSGDTISGTHTQAGSFSFTLQVADASAVPALASREFSITIGKAVLTVTATSITKPPGYANPDFTASYSGFINGDKVSVLSGTPSFTTTATTESPAGSYDIIISQGTLDSPNYGFTFVNGILSVSEMTTDSLGKTTVPIALTASPGSQVTIAAGTLLTDAEGNPVSGPFTMASTPMGSMAALPQGASTGHSGETSLVALGASIDLNLSAGGVKITKIDPPMVVKVVIPSTFAVPDTLVSYYSFDGTSWRHEGDAWVNADGSVDMQVWHLSIWAVAKFEKLPSGKIALNSTATDPVTVADALRALQIAVGMVAPTPNDLVEGDVAPLVNGRPSPNKQINVGDAIVILQKSLGVVGW